MTRNPLTNYPGCLAVLMILTFWITDSFAGNLIGISGSTKFRIDDVTGIATSLVSVSIPDFGIDQASFQDRLYILSYNSSGAARIYKENINSGTSYGYVDVSANILRIACRSDGSLVGLTGSQVLLINTATGGTSVIGSATIPYIGASDAKSQNMLYVLGADSPSGATKVYKVNMASGGVVESQLNLERFSHDKYVHSIPPNYSQKSSNVW